MEEFYSWTKLFEANVSESLSQAYDEYSMVFAAPTIEPERLLDSQNLRVELVNALKMLSKQQSMVMQLYYVEDLNTYEIAAVLDLSPGRVSQIKSEAFKALQSKLQNYSDLINDCRALLSLGLFWPARAVGLAYCRSLLAPLKRQ